MTPPPERDHEPEPWRFPPRTIAPRRDLGPAALPYARVRALRPLLGTWHAQDEFTAESIEIASVLAEEAVQAFLRARTQAPFPGVSVVTLGFEDEPTLLSFRRIRAVRAADGGRSWRLVRTWAVARGDGGLDEAMCAAVARYLNLEFAGLLSAGVVTWVGRR